MALPTVLDGVCVLCVCVWRAGTGSPAKRICRTYPKYGEAAAKCSGDTNKWTRFGAMTMGNMEGMVASSSILSVKPEDLKVHAQRWYYLDICLSPGSLTIYGSKRGSQRSIIKTGQCKPFALHPSCWQLLHRPSRVLRQEKKHPGAGLKGERPRESHFIVPSGCLWCFCFPEVISCPDPGPQSQTQSQSLDQYHTKSTTESQLWVLP